MQTILNYIINFNIKSPTQNDLLSCIAIAKRSNENSVISFTILKAGRTQKCEFFIETFKIHAHKCPNLIKIWATR